MGWVVGWVEEWDKEVFRRMEKWMFSQIDKGMDG